MVKKADLGQPFFLKSFNLLRYFKPSIMRAKGFTLVELVAVILILGILGVSVYPNISSGGFSSVAEQQQIISLLRTVQNRAMQNTQDGQCQGVYFSASNIGLAAQLADGICALSLAVNPSDNDGYLNVELENSYGISPAAVLVEFDDLGRPLLFDADRNPVGTSMVITIDGTYTVTIESQGYIHD